MAPKIFPTAGQLAQTYIFLALALVNAATGGLLDILLRYWRRIQFWLVLALTCLAILALLIFHSNVQATFLNYNSPEEHLVYAHCEEGMAIALAQIEEVSHID